MNEQTNYAITKVIVSKVTTLTQCSRGLVPVNDGDITHNWMEAAHRKQSMAFVPSFLQISGAPTDVAAPVEGWDMVRLNFVITIQAVHMDNNYVTHTVQGYSDCDSREAMVRNNLLLLPEELTITLNETTSNVVINNQTVINGTDILLTDPAENAVDSSAIAVTPSSVFSKLHTDLMFDGDEYVDMNGQLMIDNGGAAISKYNPVRSDATNASETQFANALQEQYTSAVALTHGNLLDSPYGIASTIAGSGSVIDNPVIRWLTNNAFATVDVSWGSLRSLFAMSDEETVVYNEYDPIIGSQDIMVGDWRQTDLTTHYAARVKDGINLAMSASGLDFVDIAVHGDINMNMVITPMGSGYHGLVADPIKAWGIFEAHFQRTWETLVRPYGPYGTVTPLSIMAVFHSNYESNLTINVDGMGETYYQVANWATGLTHSSRNTEENYVNITDTAGWVLNQLEA